MTLHEDLDLCVPEYGPLRSYPEWASKTTDAEHLFHVAAILPVIADLCTSAGFVIDPQRRLRPTLWTFITGVPASAKSTAMNRARTFYRSLLATSAGHAVTDPYIMAEGSWPGIFVSLASRYNPETDLSTGILTRDEAARLLDAKDTTISDNLCNLTDGEPIVRHLRSSQTENKNKPGSVPDRLKNPAFSGCLATTFARLQDVTQPSYIEGGLYSRFLWFVGQHHLPDPQLEVDMHEAEGRRVLDEWLELTKWILGMQALKEPHERVVTFGEDVNKLLKDTLFSDFKKHAATDSRMNATRKRGLTQAKILAGLYALSCQRTAVDYEDMVRAINLVEMSTHGLETLDRKFLPSPSSQTPAALADKAFETIKAWNGGDGCPRTPLYRALMCSKTMLESLLETLTDEGAIAQVQAPKHVGAGRPILMYRVTRADRFGAAPMRVSGRAKHLRLVVTPPTLESTTEPATELDEPDGSK